MNPEKARNVLNEGATALNALGVKWWVSAGTALGLYRDGLSDEFLTRDTDIDIGVWGDSMHGEIKRELTLRGFSELVTYRIRHWAQLAMVKDGIIFDIYFFMPFGDILENVNECGTMTKPARFCESPELIMGYPAPAPIEEYLDVRYGDWKTPKGKAPWYEQAANLS
jgi:hypothetical protein